MEENDEGNQESSALTSNRAGRPPIRHGKKAAKRKFVRNSVSFREKLEIINYYALSGSMEMTLSRFHPGIKGRVKESKRKQIYKWVKDRMKIERQGFSWKYQSHRKCPTLMISRLLSISTLITQNVDINATLMNSM